MLSNLTSSCLILKVVVSHNQQGGQRKRLELTMLFHLHVALGRSTSKNNWNLALPTSSANAICRATIATW